MVEARKYFNTLWGLGSLVRNTRNGNRLSLFSTASMVQGVNSHISCGFSYLAAGAPLRVYLSPLTVY